MNRSIEGTKSEVLRQIREIQDRYRLEVEPLIKILSDIQALEPPKPVFIDMASLTDKQREAWMDRLKASGVPLDEAE